MGVLGRLVENVYICSEHFIDLHINILHLFKFQRQIITFKLLSIYTTYQGQTRSTLGLFSSAKKLSNYTRGCRFFHLRHFSGPIATATLPMLLRCCHRCGSTPIPRNCTRVDESDFVFELYQLTNHWFTDVTLGNNNKYKLLVINIFKLQIKRRKTIEISWKCAGPKRLPSYFFIRPSTMVSKVTLL